MLTPQDRLLDETSYESDVLREAARRLNFIGVLAVRYQPPELLQFLADLAQGLRQFEGCLQRKEQRNPRQTPVPRQKQPDPPLETGARPYP